MSGNNLVDTVGVYGTKGQPSSLNAPGAREAAVSWIDPQGHLWLFGGYANAAMYHYWGPLNDLWKYDPAANAWTWVSGDDSPGSAGVYGIRGVASPDNVPGARSEAASWSAADGRLWLFGGWGVDGDGHWGELNDLWRFDTATGNWTWVSGSKSFCQGGIYGAKGAAAPENVPGARSFAVTWIDSSGKLWLFGGGGWDSLGENAGLLNDLWKFDPRTGLWQWISGSDRREPPGSFGTKGLTLPSNAPGGMAKAAAWIDADDNLWLFGGSGMIGDFMNALWKFDTTSLEWTWVGGSDSPDQPAHYGTRGAASALNIPGAMRGAIIWPGAHDEVWLFGGYGYTATESGYLHDLWTFDPATLNWTWMDGSSVAGYPSLYGTRGVASPWNYPGGRTEAVAWKDSIQGELWLFGGEGYDPEGTAGRLNDLWRYHSIGTATPPSTVVRLTLAPGTATVDRTESVQFNAMVHNAPNDSVVWSLSGAGCSGASCGTLSSSGLYTAPEIVPSPATVTVTATSAAYPSKSASATVTIVDAPVVVTVAPGSAGVYVGESVLFRTSVEHVTDRDVIWSLSGSGCAGAACGTISDSGLYTAPALVPDPPVVTVTAASAADPSKSANATITILEAVSDEWAWISGSNTANDVGVHGQKGVADPANVPGGRDDAASWTDPSGRLWLFGGQAEAPYQQGMRNDLWMYDPATREWTWLSGSLDVNRTGSYGVMGVPDPSNIPGARVNPVTWTDPGGNLWLFGGFGYGVDPNTGGELSDLWRYEPATGNWIWVSGNRGLYWSGFYGTKGVPDPVNKPGARYRAVSWTDASGDLWLFGGSGYDSGGGLGWLNDLWRFHRASSEWSWESGRDTRSQPGVYGIKGEASPDNVPGARLGAVSWSDSQGRLWLFGGTGYVAEYDSGRLNDLWRYDPVSRQWTWIAGSNASDQLGTYGLRGVPDPSNVPGGRYLAVSWRDDQDKLWLFGGTGLDSSMPADGMLNDLWVFDPATLEWTWKSGSPLANQGGTYGTKGVADAANTPGSRELAVSWVDLRGHLWLFGGNGQTEFAIGGMLNDLWKYYRR
jgi:N-acetylneuraminic acid mutarotase